MIDLTHAEERINVFEGSERKKTIFWNNSLRKGKIPVVIKLYKSEFISIIFTFLRLFSNSNIIFLMNKYQHYYY